MKAPFAMALVFMMGACAGPPIYHPPDDTNFVALDDLIPRAPELDGRIIRTYGLVFMNQHSRNVVSRKGVNEQVCIGLLVTVEDLEPLRVHDGKWRIVEGRFDKDGCGGTTICHDSCGPYAIADPMFFEAPASSRAE